MILMLLFAQSLFAALPCQMPAQNPAMAFTDMAGMDCAEKANPNACLQQCMADDQSTVQVQIAIAAVPAPAALTLPAVLDSGVAIPGIVIVVSRSPDPPPSIRFCSFQL